MKANLYDQSGDVIDKYVMRAFNQLTNSGRISLMDEPMEEHRDIELVHEVAQELFEEENSNVK